MQIACLLVFCVISSLFELAVDVRQIAYAAEIPMEYRLEHIVPHIDYTWENLSSAERIEAAPDGSLWILDGKDNLQHFYSDGLLISSLPKGSVKLDYSDMAIANDGSVFLVGYKYSESGNSGTYIVRHYREDGTPMGEFALNEQPYMTYGARIAVDLNGNVWLLLPDEIRQLTPSGDLIHQFNTNIYPSINQNIHISFDGTIWILGNDLEHFTKTGVLINKFQNPEGTCAGAVDGSLWCLSTQFSSNSGAKSTHLAANGQILSDFTIEDMVVKDSDNLIQDIAVSPDGSLWLTMTFNYNDYFHRQARIYHFNNNEGLLSTFGPNLNFTNPSFLGLQGISLTQDNSFWVADTKTLKHISNQGDILEKFNNNGVLFAADGSGWILINTGEYGRAIGHINNDHSFTVLSEYQYGKYDFGLESLAFASDNSVWTIGLCSGRSRPCYQIDHRDKYANFLARYSEGSDGYAFPPNRPLGITVAADDSIWLAKAGESIPPGIFPTIPITAPIQHYRPDGTLLAEYSSHGSGLGQLLKPSDIKLLKDGSFWVVDSGNHRIQHFSANGDYLEHFGARGHHAGQFQFNEYSNIAVASDSAIWVNDTETNRLQKFIPYPKAKTAHPFKAIILAGSDKPSILPSNNPWHSLWQLAQKAYSALLFQGFKAHEELYLLTAGNTQMDLDQNGELDDLYSATRAQLKMALTEWAKDSTDVVLYLAAKSNGDALQLNATETITSSELNAWLSELEQLIPGKITVILETDQAGRFITALNNAQRPRRIIASSQAGQPALLANHGVNSFSYAFWNQVRDGEPLTQAIQAGQQAINSFRFQNQALQALVETNGDGQANNQDLIAIANECLGMCNKNTSKLPVLKSHNTLSNGTSAEFFLHRTTTENLADAWAIVERPGTAHPDSENVLNLDKIPLTCGKNQCRGRYARFTESGTYRIHFYALDAQYRLNALIHLEVKQPKSQTQTAAEYIESTQTLYLYDLQIMNHHYQANFQLDYNGFFQLQAFGPIQESITPVAKFDPYTAYLTIPEARVNGQLYQGRLQWLNTGLLQFLEAAPKP